MIKKRTGCSCGLYRRPDESINTVIIVKLVNIVKAVNVKK